MLDTTENDLSIKTYKRIKWGRPVNEIKGNSRTGRKRYEHKKRNSSMKPLRDLPKMERMCMGYGMWGGDKCGKVFTATGKFNRLCSRCKKWAEDNGY